MARSFPPAGGVGNSARLLTGPSQMSARQASAQTRTGQTLRAVPGTLQHTKFNAARSHFYVDRSSGQAYRLIDHHTCLIRRPSPWTLLDSMPSFAPAPPPRVAASSTRRQPSRPACSAWETPHWHWQRRSASAASKNRHRRLHRRPVLHPHPRLSHLRAALPALRIPLPAVVPPLTRFAVPKPRPSTLSAARVANSVATRG